MKKSIEELQEMIDSSPVKPSQTWRHYKGSVYKIEELLVDCNTNEIMVAYTCYDWNNLTPFKFTRPLSEWFDEVEPGVQRFCRVRNRNVLMTDEEFAMIPTITKNRKEEADEGLDGMRKLWHRISRYFRHG
jgi:hypothetical protein